MSKRNRRWVIVLNNPTKKEIARIMECQELHVSRMIVADEVGQGGTNHLQGFVHFKNAKTLTAVKRWLGTNRVHLEVARGTDYEAYFYCVPFADGGTEEEKTVENCKVLLEFGIRPEEVELSAWERIVSMIKSGMSNYELAEIYPHEAVRCAAAIDKFRLEHDRLTAQWRDVKVTYLHGDTGVGKTRSVMETFGYHNVYRATDKKHPFDTYNGQDVLVFEEFRSQYRIEDMLNWLDGYPIELPARYANKMAKFTEVFIITNWPLEKQYENIQLMHSKTWDAFLRRIDDIIELKLDKD